MNYPAVGAFRAFSFGPYTFVPEKQMLLNGVSEVRVGGRAMDLLTALLERAGQLLTKDELIARVWPNLFVGESNLKVNVAALRRALGDGAASTEYIATMTGVGYRFVAPVTTIEALRSASDSSRAVAPMHNLPLSTTRIVGRGDSIAFLRHELGEARLVSIVGPGGIGKTTVALAVAEQLIGSFRDGIWLVDFAPLKEPSDVVRTVATAVGLWVHSADVMAALEKFLSDREMLLVLDNCEHMTDAIAPCLDQLLASAPSLKIIATSREPLRSGGERVHRLTGLAVPLHSSRLSVEDALAYPAVQLFVDRATDRLGSFKLCDADVPSVVEVCRRLDGIALAIELAAMRVDVFGVDGLQRELVDRFRLLAGRRGGLERHRTLAATLDWSYGLLPMREAALSRAISVFSGAFDLDSATAVFGENAADGLEELAAKSLLNVDFDGDEVGYRLLETTRVYCLERLRESGEEPLIRRRHAEHICAVLERATGEWAHRPSRDWARAYGRHLDGLRAALDWLGEHSDDPSLCIRLTIAGSLLWNHFSLAEESRVRVSHAVAKLQAAGLMGSAAEMQLQQSLSGAILLTRGPEPTARDALRRALDIAFQLGDVDHQLRCLRTLSAYQVFGGEHDAATRTLETFLAIAEAKDPSAVPSGEIRLAVSDLFLGRVTRARERLQRFHGHYVDDANAPRFARFLFDGDVQVGNLMSHIHWLMGYPDTALRIIDATVEFARKAENQLSLTTALAFACLNYFWSGRLEDCARFVTMLDEQIARHGIVMWRPLAVFCRGALAHARNETDDDGIATLERAVAEFRTTQHNARLPFYLGVLADAYAKRGRLIDATTTVQAALDLADMQNERWCVPELLRIQACALVAESKADEAEIVFIRSMAAADEMGALSWRLRTATDLTRLWNSRSRTNDGKRLLRSVYNEFTEGFETPDLVLAADVLSKM